MKIKRKAKCKGQKRLSYENLLDNDYLDHDIHHSNEKHGSVVNHSKVKIIN